MTTEKSRNLYDLSLRVVSHNYHHLITDLKLLPAQFKFDIYAEMLFKQGRISLVAMEFGKLENFLALLSVNHKRSVLHRMFEMILHHGDRLHHCLTDSLIVNLEGTKNAIRLDCMMVSLNYGEFLAEAGWYNQSQKILKVLLNKIKQENIERKNDLDIECRSKLLHNFTSLYKYEEAKYICDNLKKDYLVDNSIPVKVIYTILIF